MAYVTAWIIRDKLEDGLDGDKSRRPEIISGRRFLLLRSVESFTGFRKERTTLTEPLAD